jgi:hypothetical protein
MAAFSNQKTYISITWRKQLEAIFGKIPFDGGVQWRVGVKHPHDSDPTANSDLINQELDAVQAEKGELVVLLCNP